VGKQDGEKGKRERQTGKQQTRLIPDGEEEAKVIINEKSGPIGREVCVEARTDDGSC